MANETPISQINVNPSHEVDNAELLFGGTYTRDGYDLVITGAEGESLVVADYFSFTPPPSLILPNGASMTPSMVKSFLHIPLEGALYAASEGAAGAAPLVQIGTVGFLSGRVVRIDKNGVEEVLKKGDAIFQGDEIRVDGRGFVLAKMVDGTRFRLGSDARAKLEEFTYDKKAEIGNFEAKVLKGAFSYKSGGIGKFGKGGEHSKISTPSAVIGIRGSELEGDVKADGSTTVIHTSGVLTVTDQAGNNPVTLDVPGNTTVIILNGIPSPAAQATPAQQASVQAGMPPPSQEEATDKVESEKQVEEAA
ncbi:MAG: hypothetical protein ACI9FB_002683, partial [Candidatus Azotimanducaceae bacterium]